MKTIFHGSKLNTIALNTYLKLMRASEKTAAETHRHLAEHKLTSSQFAAMEALYHLGPLSQREIGRKLLKSHGNITTVINNLEKRKLAKRHQNRADRRFLSVALTEQGQKLIEEIFPQHAAGIEHRMNSLTAAEQHELGRLCRKLGLA